MRGRGLFCRKVPSLALPPEKTKGVGEILGGEAASLREAPLPQTPLSRRAVGNRLELSFGLARPCEWARFLVLGLWSRRLTEPPRPLRRLGTNPSARLRRKSISSTIRSANGPPPSAEEGKGWRRSRHKLLFRAFQARPKDGARLAALRSPFGNLRPPSSCNWSVSNVGRSRRLCQPP